MRPDQDRETKDAPTTEVRRSRPRLSGEGSGSVLEYLRRERHQGGEMATGLDEAPPLQPLNGMPED